MIGFITNALVITTQRHLSYYQGKEDHHKVQRMFANSIILSKIIFPKYGWNLKDEDDPTGELTEEVTEAMTEEVNEEDTVSDSMKEG